MQTFHIPIQSRALVRASLEVRADSKAEAIKKVKAQLEVGNEPDCQEVGDVSWSYEFIEDNEDIWLREDGCDNELINKGYVAKGTRI